MCERFLNDQQNLTMIEFVSIFWQCLSILQYLHENNFQILHRDIKSSNILIQFKKSNHIHIKFKDFDLSKNYNHLLIICGTYDYFEFKIYQIVITAFVDVNRHDIWIEYEVSITAEKVFW